MPQHIDYEEEAKFRVWYLNSTGGAARDSLTVRDYFATMVLGAFITSTKFDGSVSDYVKDAYNVADAMMKERAK